MQPFNYNTQAVNPLDSFLSGVQARQAMDQKAAMQQQQQAQMQQQQQMGKDLELLTNNPNPSAQDYAKLTLKYPQIGDQLQKVWGNLSTEQQQSKISLGTQVLAALKNGNSEVAIDLLKSQAEAMRNSGDELGAKSTEALARTAEVNPKVASDTVALSLASAMGAKDFDKNLGALLKTSAEAQKLEAEAANLPTKYALENAEMVENIESKRLKRQLDVLDSQIRAADTDVKRQELQMKRDEVQSKLSKTSEEKTVAAQTALTAVNSQLASLDKVLKHPILESEVVGPGTVLYRTNLKIPGTSNAKDFEQLVETVRSQQFLTNLAQLKQQGGTLGQVTEKEGERLEKSLASLDTTQSPKAFKAAANTIKKSLENIQRAIIASGNLPTDKKGAGATLVVKSPKYGNVTEAMVNRALRDNPGLTREQALQFFSGQ